MDANELASRVATAMFEAEGTGPAWGLKIEEVREHYARVSMVVRADMLNGHGFAHGHPGHSGQLDRVREVVRYEGKLLEVLTEPRVVAGDRHERPDR